MTKHELSICESLCKEALKKIDSSDAAYKAAEKTSDSMEAETLTRKADQDYGYACGIQQALAKLSYKNMEPLNERV